MILFFLILIASTSSALATVAQPTPDLTHPESNALLGLVKEELRKQLEGEIVQVTKLLSEMPDTKTVKSDSVTSTISSSTSPSVGEQSNNVPAMDESIFLSLIAKSILNLIKPMMSSNILLTNTATSNTQDTLLDKESMNKLQSSLFPTIMKIAVEMIMKNPGLLKQELKSNMLQASSLGLDLKNHSSVLNQHADQFINSIFQNLDSVNGLLSKLVERIRLPKQKNKEAAIHSPIVKFMSQETPDTATTANKLKMSHSAPSQSTMIKNTMPMNDKLQSMHFWKSTFKKQAKCDHLEMTRVPNTCNQFFRCSNGNIHVMKCPLNLVFDDKLQICNFPHYLKMGPCAKIVI